MLVMINPSRAAVFEVIRGIRHRVKAEADLENCSDIAVHDRYTLVAHNGVIMPRGAVLIPGCRVIVDLAGGCCVATRDEF